MMNHPLSARALAGLFAATAVASASAASSRPDPRPTTGTLFGVGEVRVEDPRILDLSGEYTLGAETTAPVRVNIVQDARGRLTGSYRPLTNAVATTITPAMGFLSVERGRPLVLEFRGQAGGPPPPPPPRDGTAAPATADHPTSGPRPPQPPPAHASALLLRGVLQGDGFAAHVDLVTSGVGRAVYNARLTPLKTARGLRISDEPAVRLGNNTLVSTRTATFPWGTLRIDAAERADRGRTLLEARAQRPPRGSFSAVPPPFNLSLHGAAATAGGFNVYRDTIALGYGVIDATSTTRVLKTTFGPGGGPVVTGKSSKSNR